MLVALAWLTPGLASAVPLAFEITSGDVAGNTIIGGGEDIVLEFSTDFSTLQLQEFDFAVTSQGAVSLPAPVDSVFTMDLGSVIVYSFGGFDIDVGGVSVNLSSAQVGFGADGVGSGVPSTLELFGDAQIGGTTQAVTFQARLLGEATGTLPIPEPASSTLFGLGLILVGHSVRRRIA